MESDFPGNSHRQKEPTKPEPKKIERITSGEVIRRKKPLGRRFTEFFIGGTVKGAWGFVLIDVLVPAAKDAITDAVSQGIERIIFGEARSTSRRTGNRPGGINNATNYRSFSSNTPRDSHRRDEPRNYMSRKARINHDFDEIILATRVEAEEVIDRLFDIVERYEQATVADLYDMLGVDGNFADEKYGWTNLRGATVSRVQKGYLLDLPRPEVLG